jgi:hypothetical protein
MTRQQSQIVIFVLSLIVLMTLPAGSQTTRPLPDRFRHARDIVPGGAGPNRLFMDPALLAGGYSHWQFSYKRESADIEQKQMIVASGGLSDLRIYDASNREVPYLLIAPSADFTWHDGHLAPIASTKKTSGFQVDLEKPRMMDRLRLNGLSASFVKRCILEASNDAQYWMQLRNDATVYNLPSEKLRSLEIEFPQQEFRYLRVTWDDSASLGIPLPRSVSVHLIGGGLQPAALQASVRFDRRECEPGVSRYRLRLPGPRLPITDIKLSARGGNILRQARITEGRLFGGEIVPYELGAAMLRREVRGELAAAELSIRIIPPQETLLDLVIEDGDNPPMEITDISVIFANLPWIYFESPDGRPLTARYGYEDLKAPAYDLEAARFSVSKIGALEARWGEDRKNIAEAESRTSEAVPGAGAAIDLENFHFARKIAAGKAGLAILPLDVAVLAHSRIEDLRIAPPDGHQIPYLIEKVAEPLSLPLPALEKIADPRAPLNRDKSSGSVSCYRLRFPYSNLPPARLVFTTSARVFHRTLRLLPEKHPSDELREPWKHSIAEETWNHADPENVAPALTLAIPSLQTSEVLLIVEEGDNSPLPIASVRLLLPAYRMRFFRGNQAELKLYYGHSDLQAPHYDLEILASRLVGASAEEISMDPENAEGPLKTQLLPLKFFWGILIVAVLALLVLVARLIRPTKEESV